MSFWNWQDSSTKFAENLKTLLHKKKDALFNIKNKAEELYENYTYDPNIIPFNYYNRRFDNPVRKEKLFSIGAEVNVNRSYVQTPTNIFHNHVDILNVANWSEPLDEVFKANYQEQPDLLWQYFGSETGMFRSFPGKKWVFCRTFFLSSWLFCCWTKMSLFTFPYVFCSYFPVNIFIVENGFSKKK